MKGLFSFLSRHKQAITIALGVFLVGALFRWEVREEDDAQTGKAIARYRGIVFPWQPCGARGGRGKPINFHVRHWLAYGLVKIEATGKTY